MKVKDKRRPAEGEPGQTGQVKWKVEMAADSFWPTGHCGKGSECGSFLPLLARSLLRRCVLSARPRDWFHPGMMIIDRSHTLTSLIGKRSSSPSFVFLSLGPSVGPNYARFNRNCVIFHKPHLQSKSLMLVINQILSLTLLQEGMLFTHRRRSV